MLEVMGVKVISYKSKRDGQQKDGFEIHYQHADDKNIQGLYCGNVYFRKDIVDQCNNGIIPNVGDRITIYYNQFGKPNGFIVHNM